MNPPDFDPIDILRNLSNLEKTASEPTEKLRDGVLRLQDSTLTHRPSRRWRLVGAIVGATVVGVGGVAAASWLANQPRSPEAGISCHSEATRNGEIYVLEAGQDPIAACAQLWESGRFPVGNSLPTPRIPPLFACIGTGGAIEVFPATSEICSQLDLADAAGELSSEAARIIELQSRISDSNSQACLTESEAVGHIHAILEDLGLDDWAVQIQEASGPEFTCATAGVDSSTSTVFVSFLPKTLFPPTTTEGP